METASQNQLAPVLRLRPERPDRRSAATPTRARREVRHADNVIDIARARRRMRHLPPHTSPDGTAA